MECRIGHVANLECLAGAGSREVRGLRTRATSIFPLGFRREPVDPTILAGQPAAKASASFQLTFTTG